MMSPDKVELVCNTLLIPANTKQFGFMLGLTRSLRTRPKSGEVVTAFVKVVNNSKQVEDAGWFVGDDAIKNCIQEIRKLADNAKTKKMQ